MPYIKGKLPSPHKIDCQCFRCSKIPWNKGKKTGLVPKTAFKKGITPWIKGKKHNQETRQKMSQSHIGIQALEKHPHWKGGIEKSGTGYLYRLTFGHPFADKRGRVAEHRLVMEKMLGRYLDKKEIVHHINGIRDDNRIENLHLFSSNKDHLRFEYKTKPWKIVPRRKGVGYFGLEKRNRDT